jgi:hypothetical protein
MTESEWRQTMDRINSDPTTAELRIEIERACWRYLNHLRENGVFAALRVVVDPVSRDVTKKRPQDFTFVGL